MLDAQNGKRTNAVVLRKVANTLYDSVYNQLLWGIHKLGVEQYWKVSKSPMEMVYLPTGQKIIFRGADDPLKLKSTKFKIGYCKYIWYEEASEFFGMEEIRNINQTFMRGGSEYIVFYSYNPPKSVNNWVNAEALEKRPDKLLHTSTYLTVPKEWLGEQFFLEAEHLKKTNELAYRNEYLGEATGTGGAIFTNLELRSITNEEKKHFDNIYEMDDETASKVFVLAKKMATAMTKAFDCDGFNVIQNNGECAGQSVFHFHMHLIPRYEGDNAIKMWKASETTDEKLAQLEEKVKEVLK